MVRALVIAPESGSPNGATAADVVAVLAAFGPGKEGSELTVATPGGSPVQIAEESLTWMANDSEEDWAYLAALSERCRPSPSSLSESDVRALGLNAGRHLRAALIAAGLGIDRADSFLVAVVEAARRRLAPLREVLTEGCLVSGLEVADVEATYEQATGAFERECRERVIGIRAIITSWPELESPQVLGKPDDAGGSPYDVVFVPGSGPEVADFASDPVLGGVLARTLEQGGVVAAIGQGVAALLSVEETVDGWPLDGVVVVAPTDPNYSILDGVPPEEGNLRDRLLRRGALVDERGPEWGSRIATHRQVVTGRNSRCAEAVCASAISHTTRMAP